MDGNNKSEVARLMARIDAEMVSAQLGLYGLAAGTAQHEVINAKMERLGRIKEELTRSVGEEKAMQLVIGVMESMGK